jgi:uncharacterized PurR-regulated membrane protein YhhQ (DUF165 family)
MCVCVEIWISGGVLCCLTEKIQMIKKTYFGIHFNLSGSVIPYVFLYPISFIVLRVYGLKQVNNMIGAMTIVSLFFVLFSKFVIVLSSNDTGVHEILANSFKMYLAGFIGMPIGIYASFICINALMRFDLNFNFVTLTISTLVGEIINSLIVFPIGYSGTYSLEVILKEVFVNAMLFKSVMGSILAGLTVLIVKYLSTINRHHLSI